MTAAAPSADILPFTPDVARATGSLYAKVAHVVPEIEWPVHAPYVQAINELKKTRNAVILGHNYMTPEIFHCVADFVGDSLQLAREAAKTRADVIVQAGVHFMAETSKILSPNKTVLIPDLRAGCSLAASITGADVRLLRQKYPELPVVTYVNTSAEVKAESDVCCTSSNAAGVVEDIARERGVDTGRVPRQERGEADGREDYRLEGPLRGSRAVQRRGHPLLSRGQSRRCGAGPSRMLAGGCGGSRFHRLDLWDDQICRCKAAAPRGDGHRMLHERQRCRRIPRCGFRAALQSVPAYEADHAAENPALAPDHDLRRRGRSGDRGTRPGLGRTHAGGEAALVARGGVRR